MAEFAHGWRTRPLAAQGAGFGGKALPVTVVIAYNVTKATSFALVHGP
jgi:hypothetical protein